MTRAQRIKHVSEELSKARSRASTAAYRFGRLCEQAKVDVGALHLAAAKACEEAGAVLCFAGLLHRDGRRRIA